MERIGLGTMLKLNVSVNVAGWNMDDMDFICEFFTYTNVCVKLTKEQMQRQDENNYIAIIDTKLLSIGELKLKVTAKVEDADMESGYRTEVGTLSTGIQICK